MSDLSPEYLRNLRIRHFARPSSGTSTHPTRPPPSQPRIPHTQPHATSPSPPTTVHHDPVPSEPLSRQQETTHFLNLLSSSTSHTRTSLRTLCSDSFVGSASANQLLFPPLFSDGLLDPTDTTEFTPIPLIQLWDEDVAATGGGGGDSPLFKDNWMPQLSQSQQRSFESWARPKNFHGMRRPVVWATPTPHPENVLQKQVGDCTFLSSLMVLAALEKRTGKKVLTPLIYPAVYNPRGRYAVRLFFNGCWRLVVIDDLFPVRKNGTLLCAQSRDPSELWVSILEKAWIKVYSATRGYDIDGSVSHLDLQCLTGGWVPETISHRDEDFEVEGLWNKICQTTHGDCLVTCSTKEEVHGLQRRHGYAVIEVVNRPGLPRLVRVRNPWGHGGRWTGRFSPTSEEWSFPLRESIGYDPDLARKNDDGTFYMDFESFWMVWTEIEILWNPRTEFPFASQKFHTRWSLQDVTEMIPFHRRLNMSYHPQYRLTVRGDPGGMPIWFHLMRHYLLNDFNHVEGHGADPTHASLAPLVYRGTGGKRIRWDRRDCMTRQPLFSATTSVARIPSLDASEQVYTVVVRQYDQARFDEVSFSLCAYSWCELSLAPLPLPPPPACTISGEWNAVTAGGSINDPIDYVTNPQFGLFVSRRCDMLTVTIESDRESSTISVDIFKRRPIDSNPLRLVPMEVHTVAVSVSEIYRQAFNGLIWENVEPGWYTVVASCYEKGIEGRFRINVELDPPNDDVSIFFMMFEQ